MRSASRSKPRGKRFWNAPTPCDSRAARSESTATEPIIRALPCGGTRRCGRWASCSLPDRQSVPADAAYTGHSSPVSTMDRPALLRLVRRASIVLVFAASAARPQDSSSTARDTTRRSALDTVRVTGRSDDLRGVATGASQGRIGRTDLELRPIAREGELLETVPGMIATQHSGDGKANQYFVRGFNLDHGTDFQTRLDGMPLNMPTHGHGQGYTDLNFLVPELVDYIDYKLGVYHPEVGDFGSAGGAEFHLLSRINHPFVSAQYGQHALARVAGGSSFRIAGGDLLLGGEGKTYNGPWQIPERVRKLDGIA